MRILFIFLLIATLVIPGCKKDDPSVPSSKAYINSFRFTASANPRTLSKDYNGTVGKDTISVAVLPGTDITHLVADVAYVGSKLEPGSGRAQNFSSPVLYTVTAENGSRKTYTVVVHYISGEKEITSFVFKAADNPSLTRDASATISNDSIWVTVNGSADISHLIPSVTYKGDHLYYSGSAADFSLQKTVTVVAGDGSQKQYNIFMSSDAFVYTGCGDGYLYALNAATGTIVWKTNLNASVINPTLYNQRIYVWNINGDLFCLNALTGSVYWSKHIAHAGAPPVVYDGRLYVQKRGAGYVGQDHLLALDTLQGNQLWQSGEMDLLYSSAPAAGAGRVYSTRFLSGITPFDAATGTSPWQYSQNGGFVDRSIAFANGTLYSGGEGYVIVATNADDGTTRWEWMAPYVTVGNSPTVSDGVVYVGDSRNMYAFDTLTHSVLWSHPSKGGGINYSGTYGPPVVRNGVLVAACSDTYIYDLDIRTGNEKWSMGSGLFSSIAMTIEDVTASNCAVYTTYLNDGYFYAFALQTGVVKWKIKLPDAANSYGVVMDGDGKAHHAGISAMEN